MGLIVIIKKVFVMFQFTLMEVLHLKCINNDKNATPVMNWAGTVYLLHIICNFIKI